MSCRPTSNSESELPSVIAERFRTDGVAVNPTNTRVPDVINGQDFVARCTVDLLRQLYNTSVHDACHSTLNLDVASDWHHPRVDAETDYEAVVA